MLIGIYLYAKREGFRSHSLDSLERGNQVSNKVNNQDLKIDDETNKKVKLFIQINIGEEIQKSGVLISNIDNFYKSCINDLGLDIVGFMCLPPNDGNVSSHFSKMNNLKNNSSLKELSMGMSNDYMEALKFDSTYLRIGSKIFGLRN